MAKMNPGTKSVAMGIAAVLAQGAASKGMLPSDKVCRNTCLTAIRLSEHMNQVTALIESNEELLTLPLIEAHTRLNELAIEAAVAEQKEKEMIAAKEAANATLASLREAAAAGK